MVETKPPQKPTNLRPYECDLVVNGQHLTKLEISPYYEKHNKEYLEAVKKKGIVLSKEELTTKLITDDLMKEFIKQLDQEEEIISEGRYYWKTATPGNSLLPVPYHLIGSMKGKKIYHQDTGQEIGDLLSQGDLVALPVGSDKKRQLVITEWGRKLIKKHGAEGMLNKNLLVGDIEERVEEVLNGVYLSLDKTAIQKPKKLLTKKYLTKKPPKNPQRLEQIEVKVLGKQKTCLKDIWKTFYFDQKTKTTGYFLVNDYQREQAFNNLNIGSTLNISLVQGYKHQFLNKIL